MRWPRSPAPKVSVSVSSQSGRKCIFPLSRVTRSWSLLHQTSFFPEDLSQTGHLASRIMRLILQNNNV